MWLRQAFFIAAASAVALAQDSDEKLTFPTSPPYYPSPWQDGSVGGADWTIALQKAQAFVKQLTLLEKVNLTTGVGWQSEACVGNVGSIPRLGFPSLCMQDSPLGIRLTDYNSAFPAGGTVAASFDRKVWYERGYQMGSEFRDKGIDVQLGPVVGPLGRVAEGGRNWEGFSPDPVLSGIAVAETIKGIQNAGVVACTKHYIMNEQEHFRQSGEDTYNGDGKKTVEAISENVDDTTLHELYLWPFADAVRAGTGSIMCSYNQINNSYGCQNSHLLNYILKGELGFQGFVMSDWQAQHSGVGSALAGLDMSMPGDQVFNSDSSFWGANLTLSIINGTIPEWRLDDMATRIMTAYYFVGRDRVYTPTNFNTWSSDTYGFQHYIAEERYGQINQHVDVRQEHAKSIREHAAKSTVLLKNSGVLPLTGKEKFTAVFGEDAGDSLYGPNGCSDRGCDNGTLAMGWGSGTANFPYLITPLTAIQAEILGNGGAIQAVTDNYAYSQIVALAQQAQQVGGPAIVFVNADSGEGYLSVDGNVGDRNNLTLWQGGDNLIKNVTAVNNNTIVVIHSVGPVLMPFAANENVTAILWAGLPGEQSGNSIADILYGRINPGAKLPFTVGASASDYNTSILYKANNGVEAPQQYFTEGIFIDYRAFDRAEIDPTYEFGFGLSYTTFEYSNIQVVKHTITPYIPTTGLTDAAPTYGEKVGTDPADYQFPDNFTAIPLYIYPYLNGTDFETSNNTDYIPDGATDGSPQPRIAAGGGLGGNPLLYDVLFTVTATIINIGDVSGDEVAQLYVSLGGPNDAKVALRGFERLTIEPGQASTLKVELTRRDVSNWDTNTQNWFISDYPKTVYVGGSSRDLPLSAPLAF